MTEGAAVARVRAGRGALRSGAGHRGRLRARPGRGSPDPRAVGGGRGPKGELERSESPERGGGLFPTDSWRCARGGRRPGEDSAVRQTRAHRQAD